MNPLLNKFTFTDELKDVLENCKGVSVPTSKAELYDMVFGPEHADVYDVVFDVPGKGPVKEADVTRCKNGASVNFVEDYMRRREPDCMRIADDKPTDKKRFADVYGYPFTDLRRETMEWFKTQELILMPFNSGGNIYGYGSMLVCPKQCAFFAFALAHLQGFVNAEESEGYMLRRRSATRILKASRWWCTTVWTIATRYSPTTSIPARPPRRAFTRCCWISASRKAGPPAIRPAAVW